MCVTPAGKIGNCTCGMPNCCHIRAKKAAFFTLSTRTKPSHLSSSSCPSAHREGIWSFEARETFEGMHPTASLGSIIYQGPSRELNYMPVQLASELTLASSKFLFVSHMGSNDSNSKW